MTTFRIVFRVRTDINSIPINTLPSQFPINNSDPTKYAVCSKDNEKF